VIINNLSPEQAIAEVKKNGDVITPSLGVLDHAAHGKIYSGKTEDGRIWKIRKDSDDSYSVEY
jgi:hypothetical protein